MGGDDGKGGKRDGGPQDVHQHCKDSCIKVAMGQGMKEGDPKAEKFVHECTENCVKGDDGKGGKGGPGGQETGGDQHFQFHQKCKKMCAEEHKKKGMKPTKTSMQNCRRGCMPEQFKGPDHVGQCKKGC